MMVSSEVHTHDSLSSSVLILFESQNLLGIGFLHFFLNNAVSLLWSILVEFVFLFNNNLFDFVLETKSNGLRESD